MNNFTEEDFLKLQNEYKYVSVIQVLLEKLGQSQETRDVMSGVLDAIRSFKPFSSVAYFIADAEQLDLENKIHIGSSSEISDDHLQNIAKDFVDFVEFLGENFLNKEKLIEEVKNAECPDLKGKSKIIQSVVVPLSISKGDKRKLLGLFHISVSSKEHKITDQEEKKIQDIANLAAHSLERIKTILLAEGKRISETNRMKEEFLAFSAHQLKTPLGSLRWSLELLLEGDYGKISKDMEEALNDNLKNIERLIELINRLLKFSKIKNGVGQELEEVEVIMMAKAVLKEEALNAKKRKVDITLDITQKELSPVEVDPSFFFEVLQNLLSNAIKYNVKNGKVTMKIREKDEKIHISVTDNGRGIPEDEQERVFTKFYRAENASESNTEGSGLGLFMVKSYVESWKGKVWFKSEENEGTTFHIELPTKQ